MPTAIDTLAAETRGSRDDRLSAGRRAGRDNPVWCFKGVGFSGSRAAVLAALLLCQPAAGWGANLIGTTSFTNSAGESCIKQSFDDGSDTIECVGKSEVEIIDVPAPELQPLPSSDPVPEETSTPAPTTPSSPSSPSSPTHPTSEPKKSPGQRAIEADTERRNSQEGAKKNLGFEDVAPTDGDTKPKQDWEGLGDQIKRLGQKLSVTKEPPKNIVIPGGGEGFGEEDEKEKCKDCAYRITSIIDELKELELPAGYPTMEVEDLNFLSQAERAGNIRAFAKIQDAMGKLSSAIQVAGGLMTGGVSAAAIELAGFLFGEYLANPGDLFKNPDALAAGLSRGIEKITIKMPVFVVDARYFNLQICVAGAWRPFKGLYFVSKGPVKRTFEAPPYQTGGAGTIADHNRRLLERAIQHARDLYKSRVDKLARLKAFLDMAKDTTPSSCKLNLSEWDFAGVPPVGTPPKPAKKKKDCSAILAKIKQAEKEKAALEDQRAAFEGNKAFLEERLANLKAKLSRAQAQLNDTNTKIRVKRGNLESVGNMLDSLRGKAAGGGVLTSDELASMDRLSGLDRGYRGEIEALEATRAQQRTLLESYSGLAEDAEVGIRTVTQSLKEVATKIAASEATIRDLKAEYERCLADNR